MATNYAETSTDWLETLGKVRWLRAHISMFFLGSVLLVCVDLLFGGGDLWSLTAIGIWLMLLVVHALILVIARLSTQLLGDDDDDVVLLPIKDALIVEPKPDPAATWSAADPAWQGPPAPTPNLDRELEGEPVVWDTNSINPKNGDSVSWTVATDAAQVRRKSSGDETE